MFGPYMDMKQCFSAYLFSRFRSSSALFVSNSLIRDSPINKKYFSRHLQIFFVAKKCQSNPHLKKTSPLCHERKSRICSLRFQLKFQAKLSSVCCYTLFSLCSVELKELLIVTNQLVGGSRSTTAGHSLLCFKSKEKNYNEAPSV